MHHLFPLSGFLALAVAGAAAAQTEPAAEAGTPGVAATGPALSEIIRGFEDQGYGITDIDVGGRVIEIEAQSPQGLLVDIRVEAATGATLSEMPDD